MEKIAATTHIPARTHHGLAPDPEWPLLGIFSKSKLPGRRRPACYFRSRLTLLRTVFWYGAIPAPRTRVVARWSWLAVGTRPPSTEEKNIDWQADVAASVICVSDSADALTFSSTMRFISRSCAAEGFVPAAAMAVVRFAMTTAEPCVNSMVLFASSNQLPASDFRGRFTVVLRLLGGRGSHVFFAAQLISFQPWR